MRSRIRIFLALFALTGLSSASAQDDFDYTDEDLPEFIEDFGYEDADYSGPEIGDAAASSRGDARAGTTGQSRCRKCDCILCRANLIGDCGGCRSCLQQNGIVYRGRMTQYFFGVANGVDQSLVPPQFAALGIEGGDQFEYTGNSQHDFLIDLDEFGGCSQSKLVVTLENIWGRFGNVSLETGASSPTIFNAFMPVDPEASGVPRLTNFVFVQPLSEQLIISVGKKRLAGIADNNIFAGGDGSDQFLNQIFCANPLFVGQLPLSTFTVSAVMPRNWGNIAISLIDPLERSTEYFSFDDLFSEGMMIFGQIKVKTNFFRKPGEHHIGAYYKHVDLLDLSFTPIPPTYPYPPAPPGTPKFLTRPESYTIFYGFDQFVDVFEGRSSNLRGTQRGWGFFGRAGISDDATGNPNFSAWHVSGGIGGYSPLRHRRDTGDRFGIGYGYTGTSNAWGPPARLLFGPRDSQVFESYYKYHITPAISVTGDLQWVRGNLGGLTGGEDAFVYGMRLNMRL